MNILSAQKLLLQYKWGCCKLNRNATDSALPQMTSIEYAILRLRHGSEEHKYTLCNNPSLFSTY